MGGQGLDVHNEKHTGVKGAESCPHSSGAEALLGEKKPACSSRVQGSKEREDSALPHSQAFF